MQDKHHSMLTGVADTRISCCIPSICDFPGQALFLQCLFLTADSPQTRWSCMQSAILFPNSFSLVMISHLKTCHLIRLSRICRTLSFCEQLRGLSGLRLHNTSQNCRLMESKLLLLALLLLLMLGTDAEQHHSSALPPITLDQCLLWLTKHLL